MAHHISHETRVAGVEDVRLGDVEALDKIVNLRFTSDCGVDLRGTVSIYIFDQLLGSAEIYLCANHSGDLNRSSLNCRTWPSQFLIHVDPVLLE